MMPDLVSMIKRLLSFILYLLALRRFRSFSFLLAPAPIIWLLFIWGFTSLWTPRPDAAGGPTARD